MSSVSSPIAGILLVPPPQLAFFQFPPHNWHSVRDPEIGVVLFNPHFVRIMYAFCPRPLYVLMSIFCELSGCPIQSVRFSELSVSTLSPIPPFPLQNACPRFVGTRSLTPPGLGIRKEERYRGREVLLGTIETACPLEVGWIANVPLQIGALPLDTREHERHRRERHQSSPPTQAEESLKKRPGIRMVEGFTQYTGSTTIFYIEVSQDVCE